MGFRGPHWMVGVGEEESERKLPDIVLFRKIFGFLKPYSKNLYLAITLILLGTLTATSGPYVLSLIVNSAVYAKDVEAFTFLCAVYICIQILDWAINTTRTYLISSIADKTLRDIRRRIFENLQRLSMDYFNKRQVGWLFSRVMSDVNVVNNMLSSGVFSTLGDLLLLFGFVLTMLALNLTMTLVAMSVVPIVAYVSILFARKARERFREARRKIATVTSEVEQSITGIRVIKAYSREEQWQRNFERANEEYAQVELSAARLIAGFRPVAELLEALDVALILAFGVNEVVSGRLLVGSLLAFLNYATRMFWPVRELTFLYNNLQEALAASERIMEVIETEPTIRDNPNAVEVPEEIEEIRFEGVSFEYERGLRVLNDINLAIKRKEKIAIVGPTGAGKTTLSSLLVRFYDPTEGRILINGIDLRDISMSSLRRKIALVPQEPFLFSGTIMENLKYGRPEASDQEVYEAIRELGMEFLINSLEKGYETQVMEGGVGLSVGQKQLISIARAFLTRPSVVVLDEAMSSVDPNTEQKVRAAMKKLMENRTAVIIAHRISTVVDSDRILVMDQGKIVEEGRHVELVRAGGLYSKLYQTLVGSAEEIATAAKRAP